MAKTVRRKKKSLSKGIIAVIAIILVVAIIGTGYLYFFNRPVFDKYYEQLFGNKNQGNGGTGGETGGGTIIGDDELSVHFLELGNNYTGDCVYIKAGETDILVDAGSRANSVPTIKNYLDNYVTDGKLEYVIATHADQDHIAGFAAEGGIFDIYECETIIQFARTGKEKSPTKVYTSYKAKRDAEVESGAKLYTALECYKELNGAKREYSLSENVKMTFLYQRFYEEDTNDENDYSVCFLLTHGSRNFLFTGDLEKNGEASLVEKNTLPKVELFKAGHHGSPTSSTDKLLSVIQPKIVCVCCCAGNTQYTHNKNNVFPSQAFIDRVAIYTKLVYVTSATDMIDTELNSKGEQLVDSVGDRYSLNGNIRVISDKEEVKVECSGSKEPLYKSEWFSKYRTMPAAWAA